MATLLDNFDWEDGEETLEFRLTYDGLLFASNNKVTPGKRHKKHVIRQRFHKQLKRLWETVPHLKTGHGVGEHVLWDRGGPPSLRYDAGTLSQKHQYYGWNFVPLVAAELQLACWVDVLFLRRQPPGAVLTNVGDVDNRLKTLFDCLQIPDANQEYHLKTPDPSSEVPFYCLLENDKLISKITVETDMLLEDPSPQHSPQYDENDARLVITIRLRPYEMNFLNLQFG